MYYAEITSTNVRKLLKANHISIRRMAETISVSASTLTDALKSKNGLSIDMLMKIAGYFGVPVSMLCDKDFNTETYSVFLEDYEAYARSYRMLDRHGRELIDFIFEKELERCINREYAIVPAARSGKAFAAFPSAEEIAKGDAALARLTQEGSDDTI